MNPRDLEQQGLRLTRQRRELLEVLRQSPGMLTAEELHRRVAESQPAVSLSTIYRNLDILTEAGLVCKVELGDGFARYELRRTEGHHHHLVCVRCGRSESIHCPVSGIEETFGARRFQVTGHRFVVYGYCPECRDPAGEEPAPGGAPGARAPDRDG